MCAVGRGVTSEVQSHNEWRKVRATEQGAQAAGAGYSYLQLLVKSDQLA
jgi:hypothetical protein